MQDKRVWGWWSLPHGSLRFCVLWFPVKNKQIKTACHFAFIRATFQVKLFCATLMRLFPHLYIIKDEKQWDILIHMCLWEAPQGNCIIVCAFLTEVHCFCSHILSVSFLENMNLCNLLALCLCLFFAHSFSMCVPEWPALVKEMIYFL